jgi:hypothetical protein
VQCLRGAIALQPTNDQCAQYLPANRLATTQQQRNLVQLGQQFGDETKRRELQ